MSNINGHHQTCVLHCDGDDDSDDDGASEASDENWKSEEEGAVGCNAARNENDGS